MSPKTSKHIFQSMALKHRGSNSTFDIIKKSNDIFELFLKICSSLFILGIMLGAFFLFNYLRHHKMLATFSLSITQPNFLLFIAISSFLLALSLSVIAISAPLIYYYSIKTIETICETYNKERNIYFDILIFLIPMSIPIITSQNKTENIDIIYVYITIAVILSLIKFFLNRSSIGKIDIEKLRILLSFMFLSVISIILMILPLYLILKIISNIQIDNQNQDMIQLSILLFAITIYSIASSIVVNNENNVLLTILIIPYVIIVSILFFPKDISNKIINLTKIGQFEVELSLDKKLHLLKNDNEEYRKFWVLINFQDSIIVSNSKDDKIFHVISKSNVIDMKFDTQNDNHRKTNK